MKKAFTSKVENGIFIVTGVITIIAVLSALSSDKGGGASIGGLMLLAGLIYVMVRGLVYIWFLVSRKLKRSDKESEGQASGLFFLLLIGLLFVPYFISMGISQMFNIEKGGLLGAIMIFICIAYMWGGMKQIDWLTPNDK